MTEASVSLVLSIPFTPFSSGLLIDPGSSKSLQYARCLVLPTIEILIRQVSTLGQSKTYFISLGEIRCAAYLHKRVLFVLISCKNADDEKCAGYLLPSPESITEISIFSPE